MDFSKEIFHDHASGASCSARGPRRDTGLRLSFVWRLPAAINALPAPSGFYPRDGILEADPEGVSRFSRDLYMDQASRKTSPSSTTDIFQRNRDAGLIYSRLTTIIEILHSQVCIRIIPITRRCIWTILLQKAHATRLIPDRRIFNDARDDKRRRISIQARATVEKSVTLRGKKEEGRNGEGGERGGETVVPNDVEERTARRSQSCVEASRAVSKRWLTSRTSSL